MMQQTRSHKNYAWNHQKYTLAVDELKQALIEKKLLPITLDNTTRPLLNTLYHPEQYKSPKLRYRALIKELRTALQMPQNSHTSFFSATCKAHFLDVNLFTFGKSLVEMMIASGSTTPQDALSIDEQLKAMQRYPRSFSTYLRIQLRKIKATLNIDFDPHLQSNIPHHQLTFTLTSRQAITTEVILIGMGTPTIESGLKKAKINPEFTHFIHDLSSNESHLYINLQNRAKKWLIQDESARIEALTALSHTEKGKFHLVTLAQDSPFYYQKGNFTKEKSDFIEQFIGVMRENKEGYHFPQELTASFWKTAHSELTAYAEILFPEKKLLDTAERQDFIELSYPVLIDLLIGFFTPTSMNITCKDGIDRAGKVLALFMQYLMLSEATEKQKLISAIPLSRAPLVKAQPMISSRRKRFLSAFSRITDENKKAIYDLFWGLKRAAPVIFEPIEKESQLAVTS